MVDAKFQSEHGGWGYAAPPEDKVIDLGGYTTS